MTASPYPLSRGAWLHDAPDLSAVSPPKAPGWTTLAIGAGCAAYVATAGYAIFSGEPKLLGAALVVPVIVLVTAVIARTLAHRDNDPTLVPLVLGALSVKLLGSAVRYWTAYSVYDGASDATIYDRVGRELAANWRQLNFGLYDVDGRIVGTNFVKLLTGAVYTVTPATRISGFLMYSWIGFLGLICFWRAFRLAVPTGNVKKYALLVLVFPSLVYWPSSIGKDAWMILALGIVALGAANIAAARTGKGVALVLLGTGGILGVRPHLAICVFAGLSLLMLIVCTQWRKMRRPVVPMIATLILFLVGNVAVRATQSYLGVQDLTQESVSQTLDEATQRSSQGGSEFAPVRVNNPVKFPLGFATVFYRPFPFEVHNTQQVIAALECLLLAFVTVRSWRSLREIPRQVRTSPYVAYAVLFVIAFVVAFSAFSNFGLLARQRTQVLPLYLVLLALPARPAVEDGADEDAATEEPGALV